MTEPHRRFDAGADVYARARPAYPADAVAWLVEATGLHAGGRALDLAAGTGALTEPLIAAGLDVSAVEPSPEMRRVLEARLPELQIVDALAEELPFADAELDLVTVANALHWFDPVPAFAEMRRVLGAGGHLAVLWNVEDRDDPLSRRIDDLKLDVLSRSSTRGAHEGEPYSWDRHFDKVAHREFRFVHRPPNVAEYISSWSYVANMDEADRVEFLERISDWAPSGPVDLPFRVSVTIGRSRLD